MLKSEFLSSAAVAAIRRESATIHEWSITLRGITTREELLRAASLPN
ncbi:MAG: hypothetical protein J0M07_24300 [Anaerolineae bacterium]|nr:hypothetical protein [Anaerolineae bacterium]